MFVNIKGKDNTPSCTVEKTEEAPQEFLLGSVEQLTEEPTPTVAAGRHVSFAAPFYFTPHYEAVTKELPLVPDNVGPSSAVEEDLVHWIADLEERIDTYQASVDERLSSFDGLWMLSEEVSIVQERISELCDSLTATDGEIKEDFDIVTNAHASRMNLIEAAFHNHQIEYAQERNKAARVILVLIICNLFSLIALSCLFLNS